MPIWFKKCQASWFIKNRPQRKSAVGRTTLSLRFPLGLYVWFILRYHQTLRPTSDTTVVGFGAGLRDCPLLSSLALTSTGLSPVRPYRSQREKSSTRGLVGFASLPSQVLGASPSLTSTLYHRLSHLSRGFVKKV